VLIATSQSLSPANGLFAFRVLATCSRIIASIVGGSSIRIGLIDRSIVLFIARGRRIYVSRLRADRQRGADRVIKMNMDFRIKYSLANFFLHRDCNIVFLSKLDCFFIACVGVAELAPMNR